MRTKHTPGDWFVADVSRKGAAVFSDAEQIVYCAAYDKDDIPGAIVPQRPIYSEEAHANARLIAAAPKMLEALQEIYHERPRGYQYVSEYSLTIEDIARKAIAKATGVPQRPISSEEAHANARLIAAAPEMLEALKLIQNQDLVLPADREIIKSAIAKATGAYE